MVSRGQAVARVVGTSFALEALPDRATRLTVYEGTVEFYSLLASLQREKVKVTKGAWVMEEGAVEPVPEPETDTDSESETGAGGDLAETAPPAGPSLQSGAAPPAGNERVDAAPTGPAGATAGPSPPPSTPPPGPRPDDGFRSGLDQPDSGDGN
jgi:hypothetical protein